MTATANVTCVTGRRPGRKAAALIRRYVLRRPKDAALLAVWSTVEVIPVFTLGRAIAGATNAFLAGRAHIVPGFTWLGVLLAAAAAGAVGSKYVYARLAAIVEPLRDDLIKTIVAGAIRRCVQHGEPPDTAATARISHQAEIVRDSFAGLVSALRTFVFVAGSALAGLLTLLPVALVLVAVPLLAALGIFAALVGAFARRQRGYVLTEESVATETTTAITALRDVTACGGEAPVYARADRCIHDQVRASRAVAAMAAARTLTIAVGGWLPVPILLAAAPWMLHHGATPGQIIGALTYVAGALQAAVATLVQGVGSTGIKMLVTLERITERSAAPTPQADGASPARFAAMAGGSGRSEPQLPQAGACHLELGRVSFAYGPHAVPVIKDLSLAIPDGDHLAVIGPSGIGKSTLANLLTGVLTPSGGEIRLGGVPLGRFGPATLTGYRVLIPQEAYVFAGTVAENLTYLNPHATSADLDAVTGLLGMRPLVTRLGGHHGHLGPATLSAGERQLIALARAYLSPARIAVLDEAACHLDPAAEARAERAFADRPGTLIVIAHRMSSALRARRILVLDGDRAQAGDHESLLARSPLYRDLTGYWSATAPAPAARDNGTANHPSAAIAMDLTGHTGALSLNAE